MNPEKTNSRGFNATHPCSQRTAAAAAELYMQCIIHVNARFDNLLMLSFLPRSICCSAASLWPVYYLHSSDLTSAL